VTTSLLELVGRVAALLDALEIRWVLGGSLASSMVGEPRSTNDGDVAIVVPLGGEEQLVTELAQRFIVPTSDARYALASHTSFNIIDKDTLLKIDLFVLGDGVLDRMQIERRVRVEDPTTPLRLWITSPEDQVLRKLWSYRLGGHVSDRQFRDVASILAVNVKTLDLDYLTKTAELVGLGDLLEQALREAGGTGSS
jgi:hypothetical protein